MAPRPPKLDLARLTSLTGVLPLFLYVVFHLWETSGAIDGRAGAERLVGAGGGWFAVTVEVLFVVLPLFAHAAAGIAVAVRGRRDDDDPRRRDLRRLQALTGVLTLAFVVVHLAHTWAAKLAGAGAVGLYERLRTDAGKPVYVAVYAIGLTALAVHLATGLESFVRTWSSAADPRVDRSVRIGAIVIASGVWLASLNTLSHYAVGRPLLWGGF